MTDQRSLKFNFSMPTNIVFGEGAAERANSHLQTLGAKKALVVTDEGLKDSELLHSVVKSMANLCAGIFDEVVPDSGLKIVARGA